VSLVALELTFRYIGPLYIWGFGIPVAISIGFIVYGTIMSLKQKNIITDKSDKTFKIISKTFIIIGLVFLVLSIVVPLLLGLIKIPIPVLYFILPIITYFLLCLGCCIPTKGKRRLKSNDATLNHTSV
jgi:hypothetical protein